MKVFLDFLYHALTKWFDSLSFYRFVEGMAPVFSRSAWLCAWHLIQVEFGFSLSRDRTIFRPLLEQPIHTLDENIIRNRSVILGRVLDFDILIFRFERGRQEYSRSVST